MADEIYNLTVIINKMESLHRQAYGIKKQELKNKLDKLKAERSDLKAKRYKK